MEDKPIQFARSGHDQHLDKNPLTCIFGPINNKRLANTSLSADISQYFQSQANKVVRPTLKNGTKNSPLSEQIAKLCYTKVAADLWC